MIDGTRRNWPDLKLQKFAPTEMHQIDQEIDRELVEMDLRALRNTANLTQESLARRMDSTQSELSKMERRDDLRVSTLRRYVEALGGKLEIWAILNGRRIKITERWWKD